MLAVRTLSTRDVIRKVKGAFLPLRCAVELEEGCNQNTHSVLHLAVMNPGHNVVRMSRITLGNLRDERELDRALTYARMELERKGIALN